MQAIEAEDADMYRLFEICSLAFGQHEPFFDASWPNHCTQAGREQGTARFTKTKQTDPNVVYLKAVDANGKIVGMAKWNIYRNNTIPDFNKHDGEEKDYWGDEEEKAYAKELHAEFFKHRESAIVKSNGNIACLDILAVDPAYQRMGAGICLVEWGVGKADDLGIEAVVESSVFGKGLYEKYGFVFVEDVELKTSERFADREKQRFAWLVRQKKL